MNDKNPPQSPLLKGEDVGGGRGIFKRYFQVKEFIAQKYAKSTKKN
jgi:hypothetical protein